MRQQRPKLPFSPWPWVRSRRKLQQAFLNFSGPLTDPPGTPAEGQQPETDGATDAKARFNAANLDAARTLAQTPT